MDEGILVFMNPATLDHKLKDGMKSKEEVCYWETSKFPKKFTWYDILSGCQRFTKGIKSFPLYVAQRNNGIVGSPAQVVGFFTVHHIHEPPTTSMHHTLELWFHSETWKPIRNGELIKPSQGWRYYPCKKS